MPGSSEHVATSTGAAPSLSGTPFVQILHVLSIVLPFASTYDPAAQSAVASQPVGGGTSSRQDVMTSPVVPALQAIPEEVSGGSLVVLFGSDGLQSLVTAVRHCLVEVGVHVSEPLPTHGLGHVVRHSVVPATVVQLATVDQLLQLVWHSRAVRTLNDVGPALCACPEQEPTGLQPVQLVY